jgi:hypothetical protein
MRRLIIPILVMLAGFILGQLPFSVKAQSSQEVVLHKINRLDLDIPQPLLGKQGQVVGFSCTNDACYVLTQ